MILPSSKPQPNHRVRLEALARMTPQQRLAKACELSDMTRALFKQGLRQRFPSLSQPQLHELFLQRLAACYNRNY